MITASLVVNHPLAVRTAFQEKTFISPICTHKMSGDCESMLKMKILQYPIVEREHKYCQGKVYHDVTQIRGGRIYVAISEMLRL